MKIGTRVIYQPVGAATWPGRVGQEAEAISEVYEGGIRSKPVVRCRFVKDGAERAILVNNLKVIAKELPPTPKKVAPPRGLWQDGRKMRASEPVKTLAGKVFPAVAVSFKVAPLLNAFGQSNSKGTK